MVEGAGSCPVVISHDGQPRRVELVVGGNDTEKVRKRLLREHRVGVGVSQLENKKRSKIYNTLKKASGDRVESYFIQIEGAAVPLVLIWHQMDANGLMVC